MKGAFLKISRLRLKISVAVILTGLCISLSISAVMIPYEKERRQVYLQNIQTLLRAVFDQKNEQLANEIYSHQDEALALSLQEIQAVESISHIFIYDMDGKLKLSTVDNIVTISSTLSTLPSDSFNTISPFQQTCYQGVPYAEFFSPIEVIGVHVGYIKILYDLRRFHNESRMALLFVGALGLLLISIIIFLNLFLTRSVIVPALRLKDAMHELQNGDLKVQLAVTSTDEIGEMTAAFNEMVRMLKRQRGELIATMATKEAYAVKLQQSNEELEKLNANLEKMVQKRTLALSKSNQRLQDEMHERQLAFQKKEELEKRLQRSKKMEALGLLAGGVAHDLNNVLSGVVSYPDLLLMDLKEDDPLYTPLVTIKASGQKAAAIVQDLLTLARRGVVVNAVINLNTIISEYLMSPEHQKIEMYNTNIIIETQLADDLLNIQGSSLHLKKSLMNLVSNAAEAQPNGGVIQISTKNFHVEHGFSNEKGLAIGDYAVLMIQDFGTGISQVDQERIFEPFYTKKTMGRSGTGLGMAVVWGTLQDHRGVIDIESEEGKGTCFKLFFPVTREVAPLQKEVSSIIGAYMGHQQRVMVIDDLPEQIEIATIILKKLGYAPVSASSGEEAVAYLKSHSVDLLLLDMIMPPGMDGLKTYQKILEIHPGQKAIVVSGYAENDRVKEVQRLGAKDYLKKPYTIEKLGKAVKGILG